jgi:adenosylhomocysteinase
VSTEPAVRAAGRGHARDFFDQFGRSLPATDTACVTVTHLLPGQIDFLDTLDAVSKLAAVLPKPKSADPRTRGAVLKRFALDELNRARFADPQQILPYLESRLAGQRTVLVDIGGYFAPALEEICARFSGQIVGVVEDTENGQHRYQALGHLPCPVYSVARSPLKEPEDRLVGEAIVFSVETLLRRLGEVLPGRRGCVLGFGKIGSGIAGALHARHVAVTVLDTDPVRQAQALARGYATATLPNALGASDLVFSATGSRALHTEHLALLRPGAYLAAATSRDDEFAFDVGELSRARGGGFARRDVLPGIAHYSRADHSWHLMGNGNAVNFLHSSAIGPAIHLIKAEIIAAVALLGSQEHAPGLHEVPARLRAQIAELWVDHFHPCGHVPGGPR